MKQTDFNWYAAWFDTPYYHILYKNRDDAEAHHLMKNLTGFLQLKEDTTILDVACGRGRHAKYLHKLGYRVKGIDLSKKSIAYAKQFETEGLEFAVHDMCNPLGEKFDAVFNLFTSFGYFEKDIQNINAIQAMKANMNDNAFGVIDFLNIHYVKKHLVKKETKKVNQIEFFIKRWIENGYLYKEISFEDKDSSYCFTERLKCIDIEIFKYYLSKVNLHIMHVFGSYNLEKFDQESSKRLILIFSN